jgi:Flp pilus assembly protein TadG
MRFSGGEEGQALVVVGAAMVVLMGALVLTLDWGYGFASRRTMQNEADAAVLAAGRLLATNYRASLPFAASQEQVWCAAKAAADGNRANRPTGSVETMQVSFSSGNGSFTPDPPLSVVDCGAMPTATDVPNDTRYVRVRVNVTYASLFGIVERRQVQAAGNARARLTAGAAVRPLLPLNVPPGNPNRYGTPGVGLSGAWTAPNVAMWPIVVRYSNWDDASAATPLSRSGVSTDANFFVSLSHDSPRETSPARHQLITESDYTGTGDIAHGWRGTSPITNTGPGWCRADGLWDTFGFANVRNSAQCDVPNWFNYGFRGSLSVGTNWSLSDPGWNSFESGRTPPQLTPRKDRSSCDALPKWMIPITAPSCAPGAPSTIGDWVEVVPRSGANGVDQQQVHDRIISFIERYGRDAGGGDKSVVVNIFLWDCAQRYDGPAGAANAWVRLGDPKDCAEIDPGDMSSIARVHLLAAVPMTILRSEVVMAGPALRLTGRWGDIFGDAGVCARVPTPATGCDLNPLMNSAFLVPDE